MRWASTGNAMSTSVPILRGINEARRLVPQHCTEDGRRRVVFCGRRPLHGTASSASAIAAHRRSLVLASTAAGMGLFLCRNQRGLSNVPAAACASTLTQDVDIVKPETHSRREYEYLVLNNGLKVILGSDKACDKAAAALCVSVGKLHEPKDIPGLAHFCEHMLFLGSQAFPDEAEYKKFIKRHGGHTNAMTSSSYTCYMFDVSVPALGGALDRFSHFFKTPLFTKSATDREIDAVDSEHSMHITNDGRRSLATLYLDANPAHPWHWGSGNAKSLRDGPKEMGSDVHKEVVDFYQANYAAHNMTLAILGAESLPEMRAMVEERFGMVRAEGPRALQGAEHGNGAPAVLPQDWRGLVLRTPTKDVRRLSFSWQLSEWQAPLWETKPCAYASYTLGHEGIGSLLSVLKEKGWASALSAGESDHGCFSTFEVSMSLTEEGAQKVQEIGELLFTYLHLLHNTDVPAWALEELQTVRHLQFTYRDDSQPYNLVSTLARNLQVYPAKQVLAGPSVLPKTDASASHAVIKQLTVDGLRVEFAAKHLAAQCTNRDPWYNGEFSKVALPDDWRRSWESVLAGGAATEAAESAAAHGLALPRPNPFVPKDLSLRLHMEGLEDVPQDLPHVKGVRRAFHHQDSKFKQPKAIIACKLHRPLGNKEDGPSAAALAFMKQLLWCDIIMEELNQYSYEASTAGLDYSLSPRLDGIELVVGGFNDKLPVLLQEVASRMRSSTDISETVFAIVKDRAQRSLRNEALKMRPVSLAARKVQELQHSLVIPVELRQAALDKLEVSDLKTMSDEVHVESHFESLLSGNLDAKDASDLVRSMSDNLRLSDDPVELPRREQARLPQGYTLWKLQGTDEEERNGAVRLSIQIPSTPSNTMYTWFLAMLLNARFFEELRTKQQLGYIVQLGWGEGEGLLSLTCAVQTEYPPEYVRGQVEKCFHEQLAWVQQGLSSEEFEENRRGLLMKLKEAPKRLGEEFSQNWREVSMRRYDFGRKEAQIQVLVEDVNYDGCRAFAKSLENIDLHPRLCVEVHSIAPQTPVKPAPQGAGSPETPTREWAGSEVRDTFRSEATWASRPSMSFAEQRLEEKRSARM